MLRKNLTKLFSLLLLLTGYLLSASSDAASSDAITSTTSNVYKIQPQKFALYKVLVGAKKLLSQNYTSALRQNCSQDKKSISFLQEKKELLILVDDALLTFNRIIDGFNNGINVRLQLKFVALANYFGRCNDGFEPRHLRVFEKKAEKFCNLVRSYLSKRKGAMSSAEIEHCEQMIDFYEAILENFLDSKYFDIDIFDKIIDWIIYKPVEFVEEHPCITIVAIIVIVVLIAIYVHNNVSVQESHDSVYAKTVFSREVIKEAEDVLAGVSYESDAAMVPGVGRVDLMDVQGVPRQQGGGSCGPNAVINAVQTGRDGSLVLQDREKFFKVSAMRHRAYKAVDRVRDECVKKTKGTFFVEVEGIKAAIGKADTAEALTGEIGRQLAEARAAVDRLKERTGTSPVLPVPVASQSTSFWDKIWNVLFGQPTAAVPPVKLDEATKQLIEAQNKLLVLEELTKRGDLCKSIETQADAEAILYYLEGGELEKLVADAKLDVYVERDPARFDLQLGSRLAAKKIFIDAICSLIDLDRAKRDGKYIDPVTALRASLNSADGGYTYPSLTTWGLSPVTWKAIVKAVRKDGGISGDDKFVCQKLRRVIEDNKQALLEIEAENIRESNPDQVFGGGLLERRVKFWQGESGEISIALPLAKRSFSGTIEERTHWVGIKMVRNGKADQCKVTAYFSNSTIGSLINAKYPRMAASFFAQEPSAQEKALFGQDVPKS